MFCDSVTDIEFLWQLCLKIRVYAPPEFWTVSRDELRRSYNGVGPEHWPQWARKTLSVLLRQFAVAALVHDWEYSRQYKSWGMFCDANLRLALNVGKLALYERRPVLIFYGIAAGLLCQLFGYKSYCEGKLREVVE